MRRKRQPRRVLSPEERRAWEELVQQTMDFYNPNFIVKPIDQDSAGIMRNPAVSFKR